MEPLDGRVIVATFASQHRAHPAGARRRRRHGPQDRGHRPVHGAEHPDRDGPRLPQVPALEHRGQGQDQGHPRGQAGDRDDRRPGRADGRPRADGEQRPPVRRDPAGRHGDRVSASPIPGNEEYVARTIDNLFKAGANVFYHTIKRAHVSGHASQEELKLMLRLTKPTLLHPDPRRVPDARAARPARDRDRRPAGERVHHRERHADRDLRGRHRPARDAGPGGLRVRRRAVGGRGGRRRPARPARARQRRHVHDRRPGRQADRPHRRAARDHHPRVRPRRRGGPDDRGGDPRASGRRSSSPGDRISEVALLKGQIKDSVSRFLYEQTKRRPMVFPVVVEV